MPNHDPMDDEDPFGLGMELEGPNCGAAPNHGHANTEATTHPNLIGYEDFGLGLDPYDDGDPLGLGCGHDDP